LTRTDPLRNKEIKMSDEIISAAIVKASINSLTKTIEKLDKQNAKLQKTMLFLSVMTTILALVQIFPILQTFLNK